MHVYSPECATRETNRDPSKLHSLFSSLMPDFGQLHLNIDNIKISHQLLETVQGGKMYFQGE